MKKFYLGLFAVLFAFNVNAFDLTSVANKVSDSANKTSQAIENRKAKDAEFKAEQKAKVEAKKAEVKAKIDAKKAEDAKKKAEQEKAIKDAKDSLNNLKSSFSK